MTRDYSKGKIYIIKNTVNHLTYIGSTCPKKSLREVATLRREILRHSVARFCDTPSRDFATLRREILRRPNWTPRPLCKKDCGKVVDNKHIETAQRLPNDFKNNPFAIRHTQEELYRIPESLIREIFQSLS